MSKQPNSSQLKPRNIPATQNHKKAMDMQEQPKVKWKSHNNI